MPENSTGDDPAAGASDRTWSTLGVVSGGLVLAFVVGFLVRGATSSDQDQSACRRTTTLTAVAAPQIAEALEGAFDEISPDCTSVKVVERTGVEELREIREGKPRPDLWIPDTANPVGDLFLQGIEMNQVSDAIATTPVVVAAQEGQKPAATWGALLQSRSLTLPDPQSSGVGATAVVAPHAEAAQSGQSPQQARAYLVPLAQRFGERRADGDTSTVRLSGLSALSRERALTRVVTTEHDLALARSAQEIADVTPRTGALLMRFPLVTFGSSSKRTASMADRLERFLDTSTGIALLNKAGLRGPTGQGEVARGSNAEVLPGLPFDQEYADQATWRRLGVPSSLLAVFDVSGSMDFKSGTQTRIQLAVDAALVALRAFPSHTRIGLWAFSIDQGGPGKDWRSLVPIRRLDAQVDGRSQRHVLAGEAPKLLDLTTGGTGLYDTALAAYRQGLKSYDKGYSNNVILLTDGSNDDPGSISLKRLLAKLRALHSDKRPVRIIGVAISKDADVKALRKISQATGGETYFNSDPSKITTVMAQAISSR